MAVMSRAGINTEGSPGSRIRFPSASTRARVPEAILLGLHRVSRLGIVSSSGEKGMRSSLIEEYELRAAEPDSGSERFADDILLGSHGDPIAVVEAKRSSRDGFVVKRLSFGKHHSYSALSRRLKAAIGVSRRCPTTGYR
jgi:hypothetical protein